MAFCFAREAAVGACTRLVLVVEVAELKLPIEVTLWREETPGERVEAR